MRLVALPILALATGATAQLTIVPSAAATVRPTRSPFYQGNTFYSTTSATTMPASRSQTIIACNDIAAPGALWNSLEVRRPIGLGNNNPAMATNATIILSVNPLPETSATNNFAGNHGAGQVTVLNAVINLPPSVNQAAWPAPWMPAFPFSVPFPYAGIPGGSLVIDIHQDQTPTPAGSNWYVEFTTPDIGGRFENGGAQSTCRFSGGTYNSGLGYTTAGLGGNGGNWFVTYSSLQPGLIGIGAIGADGVGGTWNGIPLPIDLGPLGAPGCRWSVSMLLTVGLATGTGTSATWPTITIPNDPSMRGTSFYDHSLWVDGPANPLGLVTGWSSRWQIGTQIGAPAAYISATGNNHGAATGTLIRGGAVTYQLQ